MKAGAGSVPLPSLNAMPSGDHLAHLERSETPPGDARGGGVGGTGRGGRVPTHGFLVTEETQASEEAGARFPGTSGTS